MRWHRQPFFETWRALLAPRRAIPLAVVGASTLVAEWLATRTLSSLAIDAVLLASFFLVGPTAWRLLAAPSRSSRLATLAGHLGYLFSCSLLVVTLGYLLPQSLGLSWTYVVEPSSLVIVIVLFGVGGWGLGRDIDLEQGITAARARAASLAIEVEHGQLMALRTHLDPHFLFNTLNAIAEWCREDPAVAESATLKLASLLRTILEGIRHPTWPLREEVALVRDFFELYRVRDDQRYVLELEMPPTLPDVQVPTMMLLPLFENAVTHGPAAGHTGAVSLRVATENHRVLIEVRNPGAFQGRRAGGEGIEIAERQLALAYGDRARLTITAEGNATRTLLSIPTRPSLENQR